MARRDESLGKAGSRIFRDLQERIAFNVRELRAEKAWSQEEAAYRSEMPTRVLQRIEAGIENPKITTLSKLCAGFAVDPTRLVASIPVEKKRIRGGKKSSLLKKDISIVDHGVE